MSPLEGVTLTLNRREGKDFSLKFFSEEGHVKLQKKILAKRFFFIISSECFINMPTLFRFIMFTALAVITVGCASVTFYKDPDLKTKTGLKYYISKPYVLITRTGNKDNPVKLDILSLPDLEHPNFAVYKPGWGSHQFTLKVNSGILTEYGQTTDSKAPETIDAVGKLLASAGSGFSSVFTALNAAKGPGNESADLPKAIGSINLAIGNLNSISNEQSIGGIENKKAIASALKGRLESVKEAIEAARGNQIAELNSISNELKTVILGDPLPSDKPINDLFIAAKSNIAAAVFTLSQDSKAPQPPPDFELYEIQVNGGVTKLIPVIISKEAAKILVQNPQQR